MNKYGIILDNVGINQTAYLAIKNINKLLEEGSLDDYAIFYENIASPCIRPLCGIFNFAEVYGYDGILIATTISQADTILKAGFAKRSILYIQDLEWLRPNSQPYLFNLHVLRNSELELFCRSESHYKIIQNYCNRTPTILNNFNLDYICGDI